MENCKSKRYANKIEYELVLKKLDKALILTYFVVILDNLFHLYLHPSKNSVVHH